MPKCEEYIPACFWLGRRRRCSELIVFRRTNQGYCCTFNFVRSSNFSASGKALKPVGAGLKNGLTLVVNASDADYYYPTMNTVGATIQVFSPEDFPDLLTGRVVMDVINRGVEKFMGI
jgi:acid-sensing ion channel, other